MQGLGPPEMALAMLYQHTLWHPEHVDRCPTCNLIFRAEMILTEFLDCETPGCTFRHPVAFVEEEY